ncbi:sensor histidine kinase [Amphibacillus sp. Q70]|uniref:sensor histidine kinase n=1 Tax=Amphibacillus sp. Q70 TaxID=3453416 RepID=UPI003F853269
MKKNINLLLFIFITILFAVYLISQNSNPHMGIHVAKNEQDDFYVTGLAELGWGWSNEIESGDVIKLIDGEHPANNKIVDQYSRIEQAQTMTVNRNRVERTYQIDYSTITLQQVLFYLVLPILYFVLATLLSLTLYRNYTNKSAFVLIYFMQLLGVGYLGSSLSVKLFPIGLMTVDFTLLIAPILFLHFIYDYMKEKGIVWFSRKILYWLYLFTLLIFISVTFELIQLPTKQVLLAVFMMIITIISWLLFKGFKLAKTEDRDLQSMYRMMLRTLMIAIAPYTFLYALPNLILNTSFIRSELSIAFIFYLPIIFLYLLTTGKMYLIKIHIKQLSYYLVLAFIFTLPLSGLYYLLAKPEFQFSTFGLSFIPIFSILLIGLYVKNYLDRRLRVTLFVDKNYYQESLYRFSEHLKDQNNTVSILRAFQREIEDVLNAEDVRYYQMDQGRLLDTAEQSYQALLKKIQPKQLHVGKIIQSGRTWCITVGRKANDDVLFFGTLADGRRLNSEEHEWLATLAYYTSVSLENMAKIEDLLIQLSQNQASQSNWINRLIFNWSENERKKLASDIHDSFLQKVILLKRKIDDNHLFSKDSSRKALEQDFEDIIFDIRETCRELTPPLLMEVGLEAALRELVKKCNLRTNILFTMRITDFFNENLLSSEYKHMIFRTIQELFNNAIKHSHADKVTITLSITEEQFELIYFDNGVGLPEKNHQEVEKQMGLIGIKNRIESFGGMILFHTEPKSNKGLEMVTKVPITDV